MSPRSSTNERLLDEALGWHRALAQDDADWDSFTGWLEADPKHRQAFDEVGLIDQMVDQHREELCRLVAAMPSTENGRVRVHRRKLLFGSVAAALAAVIGVSTFRPSPQDQVYATSGETRSITLAGGTAIDLAPSSRLIVNAGNASDLELARGEAFFNVRHDPGRKLSVRAGDFSVTDIGTKFAINVAAAVVTVGVSEGRVAVTAHESARSIEVPAGQQIIAQAGSGSIRAPRISASEVGSWRRGRLIYNDAPLSTVAADISRYAGKPIAVDSSIRDRRFTGVLVIGMDPNCWPIWQTSWRSLIAWKVAACASALLPIVELALLPAPAFAREAEHQVDIPAGPLSASLATLSEATGISVGFAGQLPAIRTRRIRGSMSAMEALRRLLSGSGLRAVQVNSQVFRIERDIHVGRPPIRPLFVRPPATRKSFVAATGAAAEIIVTGQKRPQPLREVPLSLSVVEIEESHSRGVNAGSREVALQVDGLTLTNLGPGRNRFMIGANADSTFSDLAPRLAPLAVGWVIGPVAAALYSVALRDTVIISQPAQLLGQAAYSELARLVAGGAGSTSVRHALVQATTVAMALSVPALFILGVASRQIAVLIGGPAFAEAGAVMLLLAFGRALLLVGPPASATLVALGRPGRSVQVNVGTSVAFLPIIVVAMTRWSLIGAGWASVAQSAFAAALLTFYVFHESRASHGVFERQ